MSMRELMRIPASIRDWLRRPSRITLTLGLGALAAAAPKPAEAELPLDRVPQQSVKAFGELSIWSEGGDIYVSEPGRRTQKLALGDTPEARRLHRLLGLDGATAASPLVLHDRIILVGGGGDGFHWAPVQGPGRPNNANASPVRAREKSPDPGLRQPTGQSGVKAGPNVDAANRQK
jgi:hypothetical protein